MLPLLEEIQRMNRRYRLFSQGDGIVIGLSGGPDSTALFLLLVKLQKKYRLRLAAAHLDHSLSPKGSLKFQTFSEKLARRHQVPFFKKKLNLRLFAKKNKKTLEEAGRLARYELFKEIAAKVGAAKIATAHTLDDQAETVLMRIGRGTGLKGLSGIPVKRKEGRYEIIRPLLGISKAQILASLKRSKEPYCLDISNQSDQFTRNRVRNKLLPWLEKNLNPQIKTSLSELAGICSENQAHLEKISLAALKDCLLQKNKTSISLDTARLGRLDGAVLSETLFAALTLLKNKRVRFGASHIAAIRALIESPENRKQAHLPGSVTAVKEKGALRIFDTSQK